MAIMRDAGIVVCDSPSTLGKAMKDLLSGWKPKAREQSRPAAKPAAAPARKPVRPAKPAAKGAAGKKSSKR
jgi:hypothetical protein